MAGNEISCCQWLLKLVDCTNWLQDVGIWRQNANSSVCKNHYGVGRRAVHASAALKWQQASAVLQCVS